MRQPGPSWRLFAANVGAAALATVIYISQAETQEWWDTSRNGIPDISIATSLPYNGDPQGARKRLSERGVVYGLEYTNDLLSNVRGGNRTGTIDQGKLHGVLTVDFDKLAGLRGLSGFANFFQIHNTGRIRRDYVGGINTIAAIEAEPTTRLSEIWLEQKFADDKASLRFGQLAADAEFFFSELSTMFLQSDWPTIAAQNLPSGGPAYPLSTPGVRLKIEPVKDVSLLVAVFNGDPSGAGFSGEEQVLNRYGVNFRIRDPAFLIGRDAIPAKQWKGRCRSRHDAQNGRLGAPGQVQRPTLRQRWHVACRSWRVRHTPRRRGNFGIYGIIDQQLYRPKGGDAQSGVSVFSRISLSPSDQNLINAYVDGGIIFAGFIPNRPKDRFGASAIYARFSDSVRGFDRDSIAFTGASVPIRDYEANLELSYQAQIVPGWIVQPNLQFVWPNGNAARNATVVGVRSQWRY